MFCFVVLCCRAEPKALVWYVFPEAASADVEEYVRSRLGKNSPNCDVFMRDKRYLFDPRATGIPHKTIVQRAGQSTTA